MTLFLYNLVFAGQFNPHKSQIQLTGSRELLWREVCYFVHLNVQVQDITDEKISKRKFYEMLKSQSVAVVKHSRLGIRISYVQHFRPLQGM